MGLAGVLPYMATSLSTVYCAWEINQAAETGSGLFLGERTAEQLLNIIEPIQVGYGAVVCIHRQGERIYFHSNSIALDPLLPRCHPLGSRVGTIWRNARLSSLHDRRDQHSRSLAHNLHASRIRTNHAVPGI